MIDLLSLHNANMLNVANSQSAAMQQQQGLIDAMGRGQAGQPLSLFGQYLDPASRYFESITVNTIDTMQSEVDDWLSDWDK